MDLTAKLQIKPGARLVILAAADGAPTVTMASVETVDAPDQADAVLAFVRTRADLDTLAAPAIEAALGDRLAWIAYPKAGKLGTDLNRDILREALEAKGVQPVRQVAVDEVWSALRFRPA